MCPDKDNLLATDNHGCLDHNSEYSSLKPIDHTYNTKAMATGKLFLPRINNNYGGRTLKKRIPYPLNSLPEAIRRETNKNKFKRLLKKAFPRFTYIKYHLCLVPIADFMDSTVI